MLHTDKITEETYYTASDDEIDFKVTYDVRRQLKITFINETYFDCGDEIVIPTDDFQQDIISEYQQEQKRLLKRTQNIINLEKKTSHPVR